MFPHWAFFLNVAPAYFFVVVVGGLGGFGRVLGSTDSSRKHRELMVKYCTISAPRDNALNGEHSFKTCF